MGLEQEAKEELAREVSESEEDEKKKIILTSCKGTMHIFAPKTLTLLSNSAGKCAVCKDNYNTCSGDSIHTDVKQRTR